MDPDVFLLHEGVWQGICPLPAFCLEFCDWRCSLYICCFQKLSDIEGSVCVCVCVCVCVSEREREGRWLICILDECEFSLLPPTSGSNLQFLMSSWKGDSKTRSLIAFSFPEPTSIEVPERGPAFQSALPLGSHIFTSSLP